MVGTRFVVLDATVKGRSRSEDEEEDQPLTTSKQSGDNSKGGNNKKGITSRSTQRCKCCSPCPNCRCFYLWFLLSFLGGMVLQHGMFDPTPVLPSTVNVITSTATSPKLFITPDTSYTPSNTIYGHVHVAKTGGTTLNGELALNYERVCGHKGYSYDAILQNERVKALQEEFHDPGIGLVRVEDSFNLVKKGYNRGRVPPKVMWEIGIHDCDWISIEDPGWNAWPRFVSPALQQMQANLELHVPCRDPLDHLLSQCHYKQIQFQCQPSGNVSLEEKIDECMIGIWRFHSNLTQVADSIKCFDYSLQKEYMQYMDQRLQRRKYTANYAFRRSNGNRRKKEECLWKAPTEVQQRVRDYLIHTYDYYHFCNHCMGGQDDILKKESIDEETEEEEEEP